VEEETMIQQKYQQKKILRINAGGVRGVVSRKNKCAIKT
jgi:hypothetical protein